MNLRNEQGDVMLKRQVSTEWPRVRSFLEEVRNASVPEGGFVGIFRGYSGDRDIPGGIFPAGAYSGDTILVMAI